MNTYINIKWHYSVGINSGMESVVWHFATWKTIYYSVQKELVAGEMV